MKGNSVLKYFVLAALSVLSLVGCGYHETARRNQRFGMWSESAYSGLTFHPYKPHSPEHAWREFNW